MSDTTTCAVWHVDTTRLRADFDLQTGGEVEAFMRAVELLYAQVSPGRQPLDMLDRGPERTENIDESAIDCAMVEVERAWENRRRDGIALDAVVMLAAQFNADQWVAADTSPAVEFLRTVAGLTEAVGDIDVAPRESTRWVDAESHKAAVEHVAGVALAAATLLDSHTDAVQAWLDAEQADHGAYTWGIDVEILDAADHDEWRTLHPRTVAVAWPSSDVEAFCPDPNVPESGYPVLFDQGSGR